MQKPDKAIHQAIEKSHKPAREAMISKFLASDEFGMEINKSYDEMTSNELHTICESIAVRLYLFNYDYPEFLKQAIKAID